MLGLGLALGLGLGLRLGFEQSSPIVRELVLSLTRLSFPLVQFRHNRKSVTRESVSHSGVECFGGMQVT